jgi:hypothetical protein
MRIFRIAVLVVVVVLLFGRFSYAMSESNAPNLPPIAVVPPPVGPGCYVYNSTNATWSSATCMSATDSSKIPPPFEGGVNGVYGIEETGIFISSGDVAVQFSQYSGETDSKYGSDTFSIQANTNYFTGNNGQLDWVQFTEQSSPSGAEACAWEIDLTTNNFNNHECMPTSIQTLSSSYSSYIESFAQSGTIQTEFCSYEQNKCWSATQTDTYGVANSWVSLSGTILGLGLQSTAEFTHPTNEMTKVTYDVDIHSVYMDYTTGEINNLNYYKQQNGCIREICYVSSWSSN